MWFKLCEVGYMFRNVNVNIYQAHGTLMCFEILLYQ